MARDGRVTFANAAARAIYAEVEVGRTFAEQRDRLQIRRLDGTPFPDGELPTARALRGERVLNETWRVRRPDGRDVEVEGSAVPVHGARRHLVRRRADGARRDRAARACSGRWSSSGTGWPRCSRRRRRSSR